jgi:hypothetical protein
MGTKMTHTARAELTNVVRRRYCEASGAEKRKILDEFIAVTGYHEKSAIRGKRSARGVFPYAMICGTERNGLAPKCCFHSRGVSSATREAGCWPTRCRTSTR